MIDPVRDITEAVDADGPVDAQNAPTGPWKTADSFPQAPTAIISSCRKKEERRANDKNSATQLSTKSDQVHSPLTVTHVPGLFCHPSPRPDSS